VPTDVKETPSASVPVVLTLAFPDKEPTFNPFASENEPAAEIITPFCKATAAEPNA
jgi:hypothetical protein